MPIVVRNIGQRLDFANYVVAKKAHDSALQRRKIGNDRTAVFEQQCFYCGEHSLIAWHRRWNVAGDLELTINEFESCARVAADETKATPTFAMLN